MDFALSEKNQTFINRVKKISENEIGPYAKEIDEKGEIPEGILKKLKKDGFFGLPFPKEYGGGGYDFSGFSGAIEEVAVVDSSVAVTLLAHTLCANHIYSFGSEDQKKKYLPPLLQGDVLGAWALTEPSAGCDAGSVKTAAKIKDGRWTINGHKIFITNGVRASTFVLAARTDSSQEAGGGKNISTFVTERKNGGIEVVRKLKKLGLRGSDTAELDIKDLTLGGENILGEQNKGFSQIMKVLDAGRVGIAAMSVGIGRAAFEAAAAYSKKRIQFGKPLSAFQETQMKIANMATDLEASRLLYLRAASMKDKGLIFSQQASMAKLFASETAVRCTGQALQIHGGYGYIDDYPVERFLRDSRILTIGEGTSEVQRLVIAKGVLATFKA